MSEPCCRACNGTGRRALAKFEAQVIAMLTAAPSPVSTREIARRMWPRVKGPAACNRLARMEHDGLIVSARDDGDPRAKVWTVPHAVASSGCGSCAEYGEACPRHGSERDRG